MNRLKARGVRLFQPILAGASLKDRLIAALGALLGITFAAILCTLLAPPGAGALLLVGPMGASAVLLFVVPASPLSQPWPVLGGNVVSTLVGVAAATLVPQPALAAGLAVGGAILAMSLLRCLHPPGGASALVVVLGGPAALSAGYGQALVPVGLNALALLAAAWLFHRVSGHAYPHRPAAPLPWRPGLHRADIDLALADLGETFDIAPEDLDLLLQRAEHHAAIRAKPQPQPQP